MESKWQLASELALQGLIATPLQICSELPLRRTNRTGVKTIRKGPQNKDSIWQLLLRAE